MDVSWWFIFACTLILYSPSEALPLSILRLLSLNNTPVASLNPTNVTVTPGKWPPLPTGRIDVPDSRVYINIANYGNPVPRSFTNDVISSLALIDTKIDSKGHPYDIMPQSFASNGRVKFNYSPRYPLQATALTRGELLMLIEKLGGLILADGPRNIGNAYVYKYGAWVGWFSMSVETERPQGTSNISIS